MASLFIDPIDMSRSPVSVGGVARRTTKKSSFSLRFLTKKN
ncbi:MAG TPA: hypothetical protein PK294_06925 [Ignavibacteria bacterium]|nr:hypothetical protein [Ignavibacteria bacterium]